MTVDKGHFIQTIMEASKSSTFIMKLNKDIWIIIFKYLSLSEIAIMKQLCHLWKGYIETEMESFWKGIYASFDMFQRNTYNKLKKRTEKMIVTIHFMKLEWMKMKLQNWHKHILLNLFGNIGILL